VFEELRAREADVDRARRAHVARAREDAELAQRQFLAVRPEHRLVADALEREWNEALRRLAEAEEEYRRATQTPPRELTPELRERVTNLVADLPRVWHDPRTPARERKRILRLLIEEVTFLRDDEVIRMSIRWKGGATRVIERPRPLSAPDLRRTPPEIIEEIRALATEQTDGQIAHTLNQRWRRTGTGQTFTSIHVHFVRYTYDITSYADHLQQTGWLTADQSRSSSMSIQRPPKNLPMPGSCTPSAAMTKARSSSNCRQDRCQTPSRENDVGTGRSTRRSQQSCADVRKALQYEV